MSSSGPQPRRNGSGSWRDSGSNGGYRKLATLLPTPGAQCPKPHLTGNQQSRVAIAVLFARTFPSLAPQWW